MTMIHIPVLRWGEPYKSLEVDQVVHFDTGEVLAEVSRANGGLIQKDMRFAQRARDVLRAIPIADLLQMMKKAGELYAKAELPLGDGTQTQEPWTPYRMFNAFVQAGVPKQAISVYPGLGDVGAAVLAGCPRSLIFGGTATVEQYKGNPRVQAHGPGFSKILLGDDVVDDWRKYLDLMVDSVLTNSGRGCINCSGIWVSRHAREIAEALAQRMGPVGALPREDPTIAV